MTWAIDNEHEPKLTMVPIVKEIPMNNVKTSEGLRKILVENGMDLTKPYSRVTNERGDVMGYQQEARYMNTVKLAGGRFVYADTNAIRECI